MNTPRLRCKKRRQKVNYLFSNFLLLVFCIQLVVGFIGSCAKFVSYNLKYNELSRYMENAVILNEECLSDYNCIYETNNMEHPLKKIIKMI